MDIFRGAVTNSAFYPTGTSYVVTATSGAINVKGAYAEIIASTGFTAKGAQFCTFFFSGAARAGLVDWSTGAGGAETVVMPDVPLGQGDYYSYSVVRVSYPIGIPASTRISFRLQCNVAATPLQSGVWIYDSDDLPSTWTTASTPYSGLNIDPGAVVNTKGAYGQLVASSAGAFRAICINIQSSNITPQAAHWKEDISTGAGGAEVVKLADITFIADINDVWLPKGVVCGIAIPASTRIAARAQCTLTDATDRILPTQILGYIGTASSGGSGSSKSSVYAG